MFKTFSTSMVQTQKLFGVITNWKDIIIYRGTLVQKALFTDRRKKCSLLLYFSYIEETGKKLLWFKYITLQNCVIHDLLNQTEWTYFLKTYVCPSPAVQSLLPSHSQHSEKQPSKESITWRQRRYSKSQIFKCLPSKIIFYMFFCKNIWVLNTTSISIVQKCMRIYI